MLKTWATSFKCSDKEKILTEENLYKHFCDIRVNGKIYLALILIYRAFVLQIELHQKILGIVFCSSLNVLSCDGNLHFS